MWHIFDIVWNILPDRDLTKSPILYNSELWTERRPHLNWKDDLQYIRSIRNYVLLSVILFTGAAILGFLAAQKYPELAVIQMEELGEMLKWILDLSPPLMMVAIFLNNLFTSTMAMLLGIGFGIVPAIVASMNGALMGLVAYQVIKTKGLIFLVAAILPHGIIELPTVLICIGVGFRLGHLLVQSLQRKEVDLGDEVKKVLSLLKWVVLLLFIAAAIETFITPLIIHIVSPTSLPVME